jgi:intein/homing endonuclease
MILGKAVTLKFYKRRDIQEAIVKHARDKEIGTQYQDGFGKRPDVLVYPRDVIELAIKGLTSFHSSEERWSNPLFINSNMSRKDLDELRIGWDLLLDIDCAVMEYSRICADLVIKFLTYCGVKAVSCKFSVTGDTPILVKIENETKLLPIKEVIDVVKNGGNGEVLSLSKEGDVCFSKITGHLEHKEEIYEIMHENSKIPLKATKYHSVFVWNNGDIVEKGVENLQRGDYLVTFRTAHELERKPESFEWEYQFFNKKVSKKIKITKEVMLLLGYYLAEGHATKTIHQVGFSFNLQEEEYINDCIRLLTLITGKKISIRHPNENSTQVLIHSKEWYYFFTSICGRGARGKHVPSAAWNLPKDHFMELLKGYINGDGYKRGEYSITIKSVSHQMIREFVWLCKLNGISCSLNEEYNKEHYLPQGTLFKGSHVHTINIPKSELQDLNFFRPRNKYSPHPKGNTFPVDGLKQVYKQVKPKLFNHHRAEQMTLRKEFVNLDRIEKVLDWFEKTKSVEYDDKSRKIVENYQKLFANDVMILRVQNVDKKETEEDVYDISVEDTERFFGGSFPVLLHNSGNKGFHIGVPFEAFPKKVGDTLTKDLFPEAPRKIALYVTEHIKEELARRIMEFEGNEFSTVKEKVGLEDEDLILYEKNKQGDQIATLNVDKFLEIDTILISSRHLYRMPYSLHEKSGLVSLPIDPLKVMEFEKPMATPESVLTPMFEFMGREVEESARNLLVQALDFEVKLEEERVPSKKFEEIQITSPITEEFFPQCIKKILNGMEDGKKRSVFILMNFLGKLGWEKEDVKQFLYAWNKKNPEPLRENYILGQLNHFKPGEKLPPNCDNDGYYKGLGIKCDGPWCPRVKNPVNYTMFRWRRHLRDVKENESKSQAKDTQPTPAATDQDAP